MHVGEFSQPKPGGDSWHGVALLCLTLIGTVHKLAINPARIGSKTEFGCGKVLQV